MTRVIESFARPLCRTYLRVFIQTLSIPDRGIGSASGHRVTWALGVVADGKYESLGAWAGEGEDADARQIILADLRLRGVEKIRYVLGPGGSEAAPTSRRRTLLASHEVADEIQRRANRLVTRHGPFANSAEAVSFVADALRRAEEQLGDVSVEQAAEQLEGRAQRRVSRRGQPTPLSAH